MSTLSVEPSVFRLYSKGKVRFAEFNLTIKIDLDK